jgi:hypothetical protein
MKSSQKLGVYLASYAPLGFLFLALMIGGLHRIIEVKENFGVQNGTEVFYEMASHFRHEPGGYNFNKYLEMCSNPDEYVYTRKPNYSATGSFENEKGWAFILSLILPEGTKGVSALNSVVVRYQLIIDLLVLVLLYFSGSGVAGRWGGALTAMLYAIFVPSIVMSGWVSYYYWAIPFSAVSLLFWTRGYLTTRRFQISMALFFSYGVLMGFATSVRLTFLLLPVAMSPLVFLRGKNIKKSMLLVLMMLLGQALCLIPQVLITHKWYNEYALTTRDMWHQVIMGAGSYPNPFGITGTGDRSAVEWAKKQGGPELNEVGIKAYDQFQKGQAINLFKERPDLFIRNFGINLFLGLTMTPHHIVRHYGGPRFKGIIDRVSILYNRKILYFAFSFLAVILLAGLGTFLFSSIQFGLLFSVLWQGLYFVAILCAYSPPADVHQTAFFPVYVLLWACCSVILVRFSIHHCSRLFRKSNLTIRERLLYIPEWISDKYLYSVDKTGYRIKFIIAAVGLSLMVIFIWVVTSLWQITDPRPDSEVAEEINSLLTPEGFGSFEEWSSGDIALPTAWNFVQFSGVGATVKKETSSINLKKGSSSARITGSSGGDCVLQFNISSNMLYSMLGRTIELTAWVRSDTTHPEKIGLTLFKGWVSSGIPNARYQTPGKWQKLSLEYDVPPDLLTLAVWCHVASSVDVPVFFDEVGIKLIQRRR